MPKTEYGSDEEKAGRADTFEAQRAKHRLYVFDEKKADLVWSGLADGPDKQKKYMGPTFPSSDTISRLANAFWNKNEQRLTRPVACQSLHDNEQDPVNIDKSIRSQKNCKHYWDKAINKIVDINPNDSLHLSKKFNGVTVHGKVVEVLSKNAEAHAKELKDRYLCFWNQTRFFWPIPLRVGMKYTHLGGQMHAQLKTIPKQPFTLLDLLFIAELTTADAATLSTGESAATLYIDDAMGRQKLGRVNTYCMKEGISREKYPDCFAHFWSGLHCLLGKVGFTLGNHITKLICKKHCSCR